MNKHTYEVQTSYAGALDGAGMLKTLGFESVFSVPQDLKGLGQGTNPEELLAAATSTCYLITLAIILKYQGTEIEGLRNTTRLEVENEKIFKVTSIQHFPKIVVKKEMDSDSRKKILACAGKAEKVCVIGQALSIGILVDAAIEEV